MNYPDADQLGINQNTHNCPKVRGIKPSSAFGGFKILSVIQFTDFCSKLARLISGGLVSLGLIYPPWAGLSAVFFIRRLWGGLEDCFR